MSAETSPPLQNVLRSSIFLELVFPQLCLASNLLLSAIRRIVGKLKSIAFRRTYAQVDSVPVYVGVAATKSR